jgi:ABC-2 type transport system permease protein
MKKYLYILKSELMTSLQYTFDIISRLISYFILIIIFVSLWKYIYSDPSQSINGYNIIQTIWYVIVTELIWTTVGTRTVTTNISNDIKEGNIIYKINKPYDYIAYNIVSHIGRILLKFFIFIIFAGVIGYLLVGSFPPLSIPMFIIFLISAILAVIVNTVLTIIIGLVSFYVEDSAPLYWVYTKLLLIFGTLFPVEFFPGILSTILEYSPIVALSYGPGRLFVNFSYDLAWKIILAQIIYIIVFYIIAKIIYKKGVKKLNVNGG